MAITRMSFILFLLLSAAVFPRLLHCAEPVSANESRIQFAVYAIESKTAAESKVLWDKISDAQPSELIAEVFSALATGNSSISTVHSSVLEAPNKFTFSTMAPTFLFGMEGKEVSLTATDPVGFSIQLEKLAVHTAANTVRSIQGGMRINLNTLGDKAVLVGSAVVVATDDIPKGVQVTIKIQADFFVPTDGKSSGIFLGIADRKLYFCRFTLVR
jgi:hypothetical protein